MGIVTGSARGRPWASPEAAWTSLATRSRWSSRSRPTARLRAQERGRQARAQARRQDGEAPRQVEDVPGGGARNPLQGAGRRDAGLLHRQGRFHAAHKLLALVAQARQGERLRRPSLPRTQAHVGVAARGEQHGHQERPAPPGSRIGVARPQPVLPRTAREGREAAEYIGNLFAPVSQADVHASARKTA